MKVHHSLICLFFFLALQDGNTGLVDARVRIFSGIKGWDVKIYCFFSLSGTRIYFCKETCEENVLIDTTSVRAQRGRYRIEYKGSNQNSGVVVTITDLMKSDSGQYRCGLGEPGNEQYNNATVIVVDAMMKSDRLEEKTLYTRPGGNIAVGCSFRNIKGMKYFCRDDCEKEKDILVQTTGEKVQNGPYSIEFGSYLYVSITQLNKSDSGRYRCAADRPSSPLVFNEFSIVVTDGSTSSGPDLKLPASTTSVPSVCTPTTTLATNVLLCLVVILAIAVITLVLVLMIVIWRNGKPDGLITRENTDDTNMEL